VSDPIPQLVKPASATPPEILEPISFAVRLVTLGVVIVPLLGLAGAGYLLWGWGFSWVALGLFAGMYLLTAVGITVGFHRLFTHRSFETNVVVEFILAALGSMAVQAPLFKWVAIHRRHHQMSDTPDDPHSPHQHAHSVLGVLRGAWHAHLGWFFQPDPLNWGRYIPDLRKRRAIRVASGLFPVWVGLGLGLPALLGGLLMGSWMGALFGVLWGGLARIFLVHHVTWSINSVCHLWGKRPYPTSHDQSRNNFIFGVLALGEGWHNNHHAFPTSARHGLRWWQIDLSYMLIRTLALFGLAWKVKVPAPHVLASGSEHAEESSGTLAAL